MRFLFVDRIHELEPGKRIKASKILPLSEDVFRDHFPGFPVVPGVLLTEMMAQAAGKCLDAEGTHPGRAMLGKILSANFNTWVRPDEEVIIHVEIAQNRPAFAKAVGTLEVAGKKVSSAELFMVFAPFEQFSPTFQDEILEAYWKAHPSERTHQVKC
jgi:3-hydroxyacyl-[acyl-carrier-protein] dehydratase